MERSEQKQKELLVEVMRHKLFKKPDAPSQLIELTVTWHGRKVGVIQGCVCVGGVYRGCMCVCVPANM